MNWSSRKKKEGISCTVWRNFFFIIFVLSQCIVYWIHFQNIHTFTYQKKVHSFLLLVFKIVENLQCIPNIKKNIYFVFKLSNEKILNTNNGNHAFFCKYCVDIDWKEDCICITIQMIFRKIGWHQQNIGTRYSLRSYFQVAVWVAFHLFEYIFNSLENVDHVATLFFYVMKGKEVI